MSTTDNPRHRFRFSLRTLFVVVGFGCVLGSLMLHYQAARSRRAALDESSLDICFIPQKPTSAIDVFICDFFGDVPVEAVFMGSESSTPEDRVRFQRLFPQAEVKRLPLKQLLESVERETDQVCIPANSPLQGYIK